ncbi:sesquiterpene cyclase [Pyrenophora seminiperda CCB06]|uniref:Terpene synthase n=1 Tax=Pyrenophora seminiperda CCB06 TaxID=1302712 RepID=A0A3M7LZU4_9PLEO|nr:sesquiterpene cyclase [Pyrenophora seminiperda CCB06]
MWSLTILENIAAPEDASWLCPLRFAYDWLHDATPGYPTPSPLYYNLGLPLSPPDSPGNGIKNAGAASTTPDITSCDNANGFDIYPSQAGLPWPTRLAKVRQSRHWRAGMRTSSELLELFATDATITQAVRKNGVSLARIASKELLVEADDRFDKFTWYLFPEANEQRTRLLAAAIVYVIIFDDSWEMHSEDKLGVVRDDFVKRLEGQIEIANEQKTPLQALIDETVQGFKDEDKISGDGGQEVIDRLIDFCYHVPPQKTFDNLGDYLSYRRIDAAVPYILTCLKFSLGSSVCIESPKIERFLRLVSDQISLSNDLASYDKEKQAYDCGKAHYMINAVEVVQRLLALPSSGSAKSITYLMQLDVETEIQKELGRLVASRELSVEELQFVDAVMVMTAGNVFYSVVSPRYGGQGTRMEL